MKDEGYTRRVSDSSFILHPSSFQRGCVMASPPSGSGRRSLFLLLGVLALLAALAVAGWRWWQSWRDRHWVAALEANNRGIGLMEQFRYAEAVPAFEEVVRLAPGWLPGKINLGIALLNTA